MSRPKQAEEEEGGGDDDDDGIAVATAAVGLVYCFVRVLTVIYVKCESF